LTAIALCAVSAGCQRQAGENAALSNMNGNQALTQNPNAMGDAGLPPTSVAGSNQSDGLNSSNGTVAP
jgi:hypothetical protein